MGSASISDGTGGMLSHRCSPRDTTNAHRQMSQRSIATESNITITGEAPSTKSVKSWSELSPPARARSTRGRRASGSTTSGRSLSPVRSLVIGLGLNQRLRMSDLNKLADRLEERGYRTLASIKDLDDYDMYELGLPPDLAISMLRSTDMARYQKSGPVRPLREEDPKLDESPPPGKANPYRRKESVVCQMSEANISTETTTVDIMNGFPTALRQFDPSPSRQSSVSRSVSRSQSVKVRRQRSMGKHIERQRSAQRQRAKSRERSPVDDPWQESSFNRRNGSPTFSRGAIRSLAGYDLPSRAKALTAEVAPTLVDRTRFSCTQGQPRNREEVNELQEKVMTSAELLDSLNSSLGIQPSSSATSTPAMRWRELNDPPFTLSATSTLASTPSPYFRKPDVECPEAMFLQRTFPNDVRGQSTDHLLSPLRPSVPCDMSPPGQTPVRTIMSHSSDITVTPPGHTADCWRRTLCFSDVTPPGASSERSSLRSVNTTSMSSMTTVPGMNQELLQSSLERLRKSSPSPVPQLRAINENWTRPTDISPVPVLARASHPKQAGWASPTTPLAVTRSIRSPGNSPGPSVGRSIRSPGNSPGPSTRVLNIATVMTPQQMAVPQQLIQMQPLGSRVERPVPGSPRPLAGRATVGSHGFQFPR